MATNITREFINDVEAGVQDKDLMRKYKIPRGSFHRYKAVAKDFLAREKSALEKATQKISARRFLHDVKAYMDDEALMEKYHVTQRQLQSLFRQLIEAGLITPLEIANRLKVTQSQVTEAFVEMGKAIKEIDS